MRQAWQIFQKDIGRLWPAVLAWSLIVAFLFLWQPMEFFPDYRRSHVFGLDFLVFVVYLGWLAIVVQVIHHEALPGTTQFWLTRPYDWRSLLGAKVLFGVLCLHLPLLTIDMACLARNGLSPFAAMPQLLIRHLMLFLFLCVLPAAVAALTRNMAQFWLVAVVSAFVLAVGARALSEFASDWAGGRLNWIWSYASFGTLVMVAAVVVYVQYRKRQHRAAQWLAAAGLTSAIVLPALIPWSTARAIQQSLSPADGLHLSIHVAGPRQPYKESQVRSDFVRLRVPVRVEGLGDRDLLSDRLTVRIGSWESGGRSKMWLGRQDLETFVQAFELPVEVYRRHQHEPVRLVSEAFVSTYVKAGDATVPFGAEVDVPGVGVCASREQQADVADKNEVVVACRLPPSGGERVLLRVEKQGGPLEFWGTLTTGALSPSATSLSIAPVELRRWSITGPRTDPTGLLFRRMRLEASFPVTWTFEQFKLADYVTWEPDQGRR